MLLTTAINGSIIAQTYYPQKQNSKIKVQPVVPVKAYAFDPKDVRITGGIFLKAMKADENYLLHLSPDRFLNRFRKNAGLPPKDSLYGGWESEGVSGHSLGHYLSACSMMYASTGNEKLKEKVDYIVSELKHCQDARKTGYVGAIPSEDSIFNEVAKGNINSKGFDLNGGWVPWYTVHKVLAGLEDAYLHCNNTQALNIAMKFADWADNKFKNLSEAQWQKMLITEYGGMNETLANLYAFTANKKYLSLADKFYHKEVLDTLAEQKDELAGKHSNMQIPKVIGVSRLYELTGNHRDSTIASFFWNTVIQHHTYVIGGNSNYEYFHTPDSLSNQLSGNTTETCNTYNMLKLTSASVWLAAKCTIRRLLRKSFI
ncbi:MAG: beta-L-arabinofuranosidase domain-containing protein [Segetibacter sp.]